jgi:hypothetical protein
MKYHIQQLPTARADQRSFHVASETHVRIEFVRLGAGRSLGPLKYGGDVVVTCVDGVALVGDETELEPLEQLVIPQGVELLVTASKTEAVVQVIWCPPFAELDSRSEGS